MIITQWRLMIPGHLPRAREHVILPAMQTRFSNVYVMNVMSDDHPGIVAAVGGAVEALGGNIDACSQTVLRSYFTLIMILSFPRQLGAGELSDRVRGNKGDDSSLQVMVRPYVPPGASSSGCERFVITAFGKDKPGVLLRFTQYLAGKDINIVDLYGDRRGDDFVLISQVEVPPVWDIKMLQADLEQLGLEHGFNVRMQHENVFVATNQLRFKR